MMDRIYARDLLTQHLVDFQPLDAEDVDGILAAGVAEPGDLEERLPGQFWHSSIPAFPPDWSQADQDAVNED